MVKLAALLLATLWLPATLHCQLESLGLDLLFSCPAADDQAAHPDGADCAAESCQTLESGRFTTARSELAFDLLAPLACVCHLCFYLPAPLAPVEEIIPIRQLETQPLLRTWQFARRAAPLSRAPSLIG